VDLPDDVAGRDVPCPACAKTFAVPPAYVPTVVSPVVDRPVPPPGLVPPTAAMPSVAAGGLSAPANDEESALIFDGRVATWLAPVSLTIVFISTLFLSWVVSYPGGYRVFSQSPLQALFASFDGNTIVTLQDTQKSLEATISWNALMLPFMLCLFIVTVLAWLDRFFPKPSITTLPAPLGWMVKFHSMRHLVLIGLTAFCLALILIQLLRGFGLETALRSLASQKHNDALQTADNAVKKQEVEIAIGQEIGKWSLGGTLARNLGVIFLIVALESLLVRWWLEYRGPLPPPKLSLQY